MPASDTCTLGNSAHVWPQKIKVLSAYQWTFTKPYKVNYTGVIYGGKKEQKWTDVQMFNMLACMRIRMGMCLYVRGKLFLNLWS